MTFLTHKSNPAAADFNSSLRLIDEAFDRFFCQPVATRPWNPAVDVFEDQNEVVLEADLPGVAMDDVEVKIEDGTLSVSGARKFEREDRKAGYHRIERSYGGFRRFFSLPDSVDAENVTATLENGVLRVVLAKKEIAKPRMIKVALGGK
jgi:HSP20 family protein